MSQRYTPAHKALVLKILAGFRGDITLASLYTGVPERTLREWRSMAEHARKAATITAKAKFSRRQP